MSTALNFLIILSGLSLYVSYQQLKVQKKISDPVKDCLKNNKVDCGCGCSKEIKGKPLLNYKTSYDSIDIQ